jgi:hypothetical protein
MHITSVTLNCVVTANAEQTPSICKAIGLLSNKGLKTTSLALVI